MDSKLSIGYKAFAATREEIAAVETPQATQTWRPIAHIELIDSVIRIAGEFGLRVTSEEYGLSKSGDKLFGVIEFANESQGYTYAVGLRNSHDKTIPCGLCSGVKVFVCENMVLAGDYEITRKHTSRLELDTIIRTAFSELPSKIENLIERIEGLKSEAITDDEARLIVFKACEYQAVTSSRLMLVWEEYLNPSYEEFPPGNKFALLMAFTEIAKREGSPVAAERMYRRLGRFFELGGGSVN